jgi:hypothetical protein
MKFRHYLFMEFYFIFEVDKVLIYKFNPKQVFQEQNKQ